MKIALFPFLCLLFLSCAPIKIKDKSSIVGKWKLEQRFNNELWLERIISHDTIAMFNFLENGRVLFFRKELKTKEQLKEETKDFVRCGNYYMTYNSYNSLLTKGVWKIKYDTIKINYKKTGQVLTKNYQITYISENKLDIKEIVSE